MAGSQKLGAPGDLSGEKLQAVRAASFRKLYASFMNENILSSLDTIETQMLALAGVKDEAVQGSLSVQCARAESFAGLYPALAAHADENEAVLKLVSELIGDLTTDEDILNTPQYQAARLRGFSGLWQALTADGVSTDALLSMAEQLAGTLTADPEVLSSPAVQAARAECFEGLYQAITAHPEKKDALMALVPRLTGKLDVKAAQTPEYQAARMRGFSSLYQALYDEAGLNQKEELLGIAEELTGKLPDDPGLLSSPVVQAARAESFGTLYQAANFQSDSADQLIAAAEQLTGGLNKAAVSSPEVQAARIRGAKGCFLDIWDTVYGLNKSGKSSEIKNEAVNAALKLTGEMNPAAAEDTSVRQTWAELSGSRAFYYLQNPSFGRIVNTLTALDTGSLYMEPNTDMNIEDDTKCRNNGAAQRLLGSVELTPPGLFKDAAVQAAAVRVSGMLMTGYALNPSLRVQLSINNTFLGGPPTVIGSARVALEGYPDEPAVVTGNTITFLLPEDTDVTALTPQISFAVPQEGAFEAYGYQEKGFGPFIEHETEAADSQTDGNRLTADFSSPQNYTYFYDFLSYDQVQPNPNGLTITIAVSTQGSFDLTVPEKGAADSSQAGKGNTLTWSPELEDGKFAGGVVYTAEIAFGEGNEPVMPEDPEEGNDGDSGKAVSAVVKGAEKSIYDPAAGILTAVFPATEVETVIGQVPAPQRGAEAVTFFEAEEYTGEVEWTPALPESGIFAADTVYTAKMTLTAGEGRTLSSAMKKGFTVPGAQAVSSSVSVDGKSAAVTAVFTKTASGGGSGDGGSSSYSIDLPAEAAERGRIAVTPKNARKGDTVTITAEPEKGFEVEAIIVTDGKGDEITVEDKGDGKYTFKMPGSRVKIEVTFAEIGEPEPLPFTDVAEDAWYYDAVRYVYEKELMSGTSETDFRPDLTTSRGMIVTMLYRLVGSPDIEEENWGYAYADVDAESWYGTAVYWARLNGVVTGYSDEKFGPEDPVSREQLTPMLYRFAEKQGYDVSERADLSGYTDRDEISPYAREAMKWACAEGIINGVGKDRVSPQGQAVRAQAATMFMRFSENLNK